VKPGGRVLVLDLRTHQEEWVRAKLGDRRLGFEDDELKRMLLGAGLRDATVGVGARKARDPFTVLVASGTKESASRHQSRPNTNRRTYEPDCPERPERSAGHPHPRPRRRDGDDDPAAQARRGGFPRRLGSRATRTI